MKQKKIVQSRFISGSDGYDASVEFNQAMKELADLNPTYEREGNSFWIFYSIIEVEYETIAEEHEAAGERAHCEDCPFLLRDTNRFGSIDGRKKWATCGKTGKRTHINSSACDYYYTLAASERRRF